MVTVYGHVTTGGQWLLPHAHGLKRLEPVTVARLTNGHQFALLEAVAPA